MSLTITAHVNYSCFSLSFLHKSAIDEDILRCTTGAAELYYTYVGKFFFHFHPFFGGQFLQSIRYVIRSHFPLCALSLCLLLNYLILIDVILHSKSVRRKKHFHSQNIQFSIFGCFQIDFTHKWSWLAANRFVVLFHNQQNIRNSHFTVRWWCSYARRVYLSGDLLECVHCVSLRRRRFVPNKWRWRWRIIHRQTNWIYIPLPGVCAFIVYNLFSPLGSEMHKLLNTISWTKSSAGRRRSSGH